MYAFRAMTSPIAKKLTLQDLCINKSEYAKRVVDEFSDEAIVKAAKSGALGEDGKGLSKIRVTLHETDLARAWFEGPVA